MLIMAFSTRSLEQLHSKLVGTCLLYTSHPTQTLTDLLTIHSLKGHLDNLTIGLCGDLKFGRTVHSLISALVRYPGIKFVLISPEELKVPSYIRKERCV